MKLVQDIRNSVFFCILVTFLIVSGCGTGISASDSSATKSEIKYVFYFIGDGMGPAQIHITEAYLASLKEGYNDSDVRIQKTKNLTMSDFPAFGMITTYSANRFITDSAAAGTALACGKKTLIEVVSLGINKRTRFTLCFCH